MTFEDRHWLAIADYYRDQRAARSGVLYIEHINKGLVILNSISASEAAQQAYCLHPIFQSDHDLAYFLDGGASASIIQRYDIPTKTWIDMGPCKVLNANA